MPQGTWVQITGIDTQGEWFRVNLPNLDQPAWLSRDYIRVAGGSPSNLVRIALGEGPSSGLLSWITVELSLQEAGGVEFDVSWVDASVCGQLYTIYHRTDTESDTYVSLETATVSSTENAKSLSFSTKTGSSLISAWCGTSAGGREVAEVEIDPGVAGTYSSRPRPGGGLASAPRTENGTR